MSQLKIFQRFSIIFRATSSLLPESSETVEHQHLVSSCLPDLNPGHSPFGHRTSHSSLPLAFQTFHVLLRLVYVLFFLSRNLFSLTFGRPVSSPFRSSLNGHLLRDDLHDFSRKTPPIPTNNLYHISFRALTLSAMYSLTGVFVCGLFPYPPTKVNTYEE